MNRSNMFLALFLLAGMVGVSNAACDGPYCHSDGNAYIDSRFGLQVPTLEAGLLAKTTTEMATYTPKFTGQPIYCSAGCPNTPTVCISTGTGSGAWVVFGSTPRVTPTACDGGL